MHYIKNNVAPLIVVCIGFGISLFLALAPFQFVLTNLLTDDSFYYFQIARNITHGLGSTFDGVQATNGYHPLWLIAILPFFYLFSDGGLYDIAPIHGLLALSAFLNLGTGIVLLTIIGRYTKSALVKSLALGLWFFNPFVQYQMLNGLETPLSIFSLSLFFLCAIRASEVRSTPRLITVGLIAGLMMLARLDNLFYFLAYLAYLLYQGGVREAVRPVLISGIFATIVVAPWLFWNVANFGMLLTSSSVASTMVNHELIVQDHGPSWFQTFKAAIYMSDRELRAIEPQMGIPFLLTLLAGVCIGWLTFGRGRALLGNLWKGIPIEFFIASGFMLIFVANATIRWTARPWYFIAIDLFISIWLAWFLEKMRQEGYLRSIVTIPLIFLSLALLYIYWSKGLENNNAPMQNMYEAVVWMNEGLPDDALIGAFNSGIQGYFSKHRVVNLDGLVNNAALAALEEKNVWRYMEKESIDYLADYDLYLRYRYKSFLGIDDPFERLELIYEEPVTKLHVYLIR